MNNFNTAKPLTDGERGMDWWNGLSENDRARWMQVAGNTGVAADAWAAFKRSKGTAAMSTEELEAAQAEAIKVLTDAKKLLEKTGLEVSFITRCPNGSKWPVLMLEVGTTYADIEKVRGGQR